MNTRISLAGIEFGSSGRVIYAVRSGERLLRANETAPSPETEITFVVVM